MSDRFAEALMGVLDRWERRQWIYGTLGRKNPDGSYSIDVPERLNFVYVTIRTATGAQTVVTARNDDGVQHAPKLAVRMKLEYGVYVIYGRSGDSQGGTVNPPSPPSGVPVHTHVHADLTSLDADDHPQYLNTTRGDERYFREDEYLMSSTGSADTGKPVVLNVDGEIDSTMLPTLGELIGDGATDDSILDADFFPYSTAGVAVKTSWSNIKTLIGAYIASAALTFTNKTLDSTNISTLTVKNPPVDADSTVIVDSAAADVFKRTTFTDIKAFFKTYFDTLYVALTGNQTVAGIKTFTSNPVISNSAPGMKFASPNQGIANLTELWRLEVEADDSSAGFTAVIPLVLRYMATGTWNDPNMPSIFSVSIYRDFATGLLEHVWGVNNHGNMFLGTTDIEQTPNGFQTMQLGATGLVYVPKTVSGTDLNDGIWFANNAYNDGGWKRRTATDACSAIQLIKDNIIFYYAAGGTIDSSFTWTEVGRFNTTIFDVKAPAGSNPAARLHDADAVIPFTGILSPAVAADEIGRFGAATDTVGGAVVSGFSENSASAVGLYLQGHLGHASPTAAAIRFDGYKTNGGTGRTSLASSEIVAQLTNGGTVLATLLASGLWLLNGLTSAVANSLAIKPGTSSNDAAVGGVLYESHTTTGQVGAGPDILATYTIPASTLAVNGQSIWFEAQGNVDLAGGSATITVEFGATTILTITSSITGEWYAKGRIFRVGATSQVASCMGLTTAGHVDKTNPAETLSGTVVLRIRGDSTADQNDDTTVDTFIVGWDDANT